MLEKSYDAILFDLDGTLIQYGEAQEYAAVKALEAMAADGDDPLLERVMILVEGEDVQDIEACRPGWEPPESERMLQVFRDAGVDLEPGEFLKHYFNAMSEHGVPLEGVRDMLSLLKRDHTIGVVSNGLGPVQRKRLLAAGLMQYLDVLVLSCEVGWAKPSPEILRLAMRLAGSGPAETLFVGDSTTSDMGAASSAGVDFVHIDPEGAFGAGGPRVLELRVSSELTGHIRA